MIKKILVLMMLVALASCGPHRMKCGARGICEKPTPTAPNAV